jgi:hypothetical protein
MICRSGLLQLASRRADTASAGGLTARAVSGDADRPSWHGPATGDGGGG